jgi:hypothetical protein
MKIVNDDNKVTVVPVVNLPPGIVRLYNKIDGSTVDVHAVDGKEYVKRLPHLWSTSPIAKEQAKAEDINKLPHLWSLTPIAKEQAVAEDAVIVQEPAKEEIKSIAPEVVAEPAPIIEEKPVSARSRRLAKFED